MSETKIFVDENGYADRLEKVENDESHQLIEEFMLAANEAVAKAMRGASLPCIYRAHDDPDEDRLNELRDFLATFGVTVADLSVTRRDDKAYPTTEYAPPKPHTQIATPTLSQKACYRSTPDGHYGLNKKNYCHFTSPIRRYSDLLSTGYSSIISRKWKVANHFRAVRQDATPSLEPIPWPNTLATLK